MGAVGGLGGVSTGASYPRESGCDDGGSDGDDDDDYDPFGPGARPRAGTARPRTVGRGGIVKPRGV